MFSLEKNKLFYSLGLCMLKVQKHFWNYWNSSRYKCSIKKQNVWQSLDNVEHFAWHCQENNFGPCYKYFRRDTSIQKLKRHNYPSLNPSKWIKYPLYWDHHPTLCITKPSTNHKKMVCPKSIRIWHLHQIHSWLNTQCTI